MSETIRLYDENSAPEEVTLVDIFETHMAPEMEARGERIKLRQYRNSIRRFTAFLEMAPNTTSIRATPPTGGADRGFPIANVTDLHAVQWQQWELQAGVAPSTINVHWRRIGAVFRRASPAAKGNPQGLGLIPRAPYLRSLSTAKPRPKVISLETIDAIYRFGAPDMTWPETSDGVIAAHRWRAWLVLTYNLAMRTRDLLSLRWENIITQSESLDPDSQNESPHGWVQWVPSKTKVSKPDPLVLPLNRVVRDHLESIRYDGPYVFGRQMARVANSSLYGRRDRPGSGHWPRLLDLAGHHVEGGIPRFKIKALRSTANTAYNRLDRKLGAHVLGHAARGVNDLFYQQWEADVIRFVAQLPQPKSFTRPVGETFRQGQLF